MAAAFDAGYRRPYSTLVAAFPGEEIYPSDSFRIEWGPVFHRGRLDGSARVLVIGQDPATHESICRRILVGEAGQRLQGLLAKIGITRSYVLVNTFLYSVFGQGGGSRHIDDPGITAYRNRWLDTLARRNQLQAIVTLGQLADQAYAAWKATPTGAANAAVHVNVIHPTYPESASASGAITKAAAFKKLCDSWNTALGVLRPVVTPDGPGALPARYGDTLTDGDHAVIPAEDLPAGLPAWMRSLDAWAARTGDDPQSKRATITVVIPRSLRQWPPLA
jgi:Uracil DNA glycosylase superfamily